MDYKRVLTIAGSDSGGGAGIQADIKTISACGCYATTAITAITVQNTIGVKAVHPVPLVFLEGQIEAVLEDIGTDAIKIGMLHSADVIHLVCRMLDKFKVNNVVLDPVMVSTSGHKLMEESAISALRNELIPRSRIITPNIPEAEVLLGMHITNQEQLPELARKLSSNHTSVFLKAGHLTDDMLVDIFYNAELDVLLELPSPRLHTRNTHGTGCTLSSALAAQLALGQSLNQAANSAKAYISKAIESGVDYTLGSGHGPVDHFFYHRPFSS